MNALLIYPEFPDTYWSFKHALKFLGKRAAQPPLGLMTVAALLPKAWKKRLVDTNVERLSDRDLAWADVALVSAMHIQRESLAAIVERCRARGLRTVVGGPIASSLSAAELKADHVVIGEAESLITGLARDLEQGRAAPVYQAAERPEMATSPLPDLSLIKMRRYSTMAVQYSRGCPFNCEFCDIIEIYGRRPRTKAVAQVLAELDQFARLGGKVEQYLRLLEQVVGRDELHREVSRRDLQLAGLERLLLALAVRLHLAEVVLRRNPLYGHDLVFAYLARLLHYALKLAHVPPVARGHHHHRSLGY